MPTIDVWFMTIIADPAIENIIPLYEVLGSINAVIGNEAVTNDNGTYFIYVTNQDDSDLYADIDDITVIPFHLVI